jgi:hypothetical protein
VSSLSLYDGATLVGGPLAVDGDGDADFTGLNFIVPKDGTKTLTVKGNLQSVGNSGAPTGTEATVTLMDTAGAYEFEVRGTSAGSNTLLTAITGGDKAGRMKVVRKTKPTVSLTALPQTVLSAGDQTVMRFTVAADAQGDVAFKSLSVNLSKTSAPTVVPTTGSSVRRFGDSTNLGGTVTVVDDVGALGTAGAAASGIMYVVFTNEEVVSAGTSRTYDVRMTLGGTIDSGDSVSASLRGDTAHVAGGAITDATGDEQVEVGGVEYYFVWSDMSIIPHSDTLGASTADWTNGNYVKVLPTDTQTMSK